LGRILEPFPHLYLLVSSVVRKKDEEKNKELKSYQYYIWGRLKTGKVSPVRQEGKGT